MRQPFEENQYFKVNITKFLVGLFFLFFIFISIRHELEIKKFKIELIKQDNSNTYLESRIDDLENQNSDLEDRIDDLESRVDDLESNRNY